MSSDRSNGDRARSNSSIDNHFIDIDALWATPERGSSSANSSEQAASSIEQHRGRASNESSTARRDAPPKRSSAVAAKNALAQENSDTRLAVIASLKRAETDEPSKMTKEQLRAANERIENTVCASFCAFGAILFNMRSNSLGAFHCRSHCINTVDLGWCTSI